MIYDVIDKKIKAMKEVRRLEMIRDNREQQEAVDTKYRAAVVQVMAFSNALKYAVDHLDFLLSDTHKSDLCALYMDLRNVPQSGYADKDILRKAENEFKTIQTGIKKDWSKHYSTYTISTVNTLKVIRGIAAEKVGKCTIDINAAESWTTDVSILSKLKIAMDTADTLIKSLDMDQDTVTFLTKMTSGEATLLDLNDNVLNWIKKESLQSIIKLTFVMR